MTSEYFFDHISAHFSKQLPFVVYRKPNRKGLKAFLQSDAVLFYSDDFTEKGFVFSPFDDFEKSVLIPFEKSEMISETYGSYVETETFQSINTPNKTEKQNHIKLVKKGVDAIKHNQFKKVVLSRTETIELSESNPLNIFKRLLSTYPSAFVYCWYHPNVGLWLGATPETLIKIEDSQFSIMALAGTQDYNGTLNVNWQEKEKQEQQYVTDFIVKNLQPSVERLQVSDVETVKAGNLLHLK